MSFHLKSIASVLILFLLKVSSAKLIQFRNASDVPELPTTPKEKFRITKDDALCLKQVEFLVDDYQRKELWALKVFDAWGKSQSGLFSGNFINFGHYEQCLGIKHEFDDPYHTFYGQHCLVFFEDNPDGLDGSFNLTDISELIFPQIIHVELIRQYMNVQNVKMATSICLPSTCKGSMVTLMANKLLAVNKMRTMKEYDQEILCNTVNIMEMRSIDMLAALFFSFMLLLLVLSTSYDVTMRRKNRDPKSLFSTFSVYTNGKNLFEIGQSNDIIGCLDGIRALSIMWVIHGNRVQTYVEFPLINRRQFREVWPKTWFSVITTATPMVINTFFLLSGLLATRNMLKKLDQRNFKVLQLYLHRYIRITPVLAATIFYFTSLQRYFGDGPFNKFLIELYLNNCEKYWFSAILHIQNFVNPNHICLGYTWFLSPDFQLFVLAPLLVFPLWRFGKKILITLPFLASASVFFIFLSSYEFGFTLEMNEIPSTSELYNNIIYQSFYARLCPYLCGMFSAYVLHRNRGAIVRIPKHLNTGLWFLSIGTIFGLIAGTFYFRSGDHSPSNFINSLVMAASHVGWSVSIAWIILACETSDGFVNSFLSLSMWRPLAKLGLSAYVTHILGVLAIFGTQKQPLDFNEFLKTHLFIGDLGLCFGIAVLAFLTFEAPFLAIEKSFYAKENEK